MYAYGPVPSRRLGKSIGVSPIPHKTCTYSCVYCQLGRTNHLQITREDFFPKEKIFDDIHKLVQDSSVDFITFVGDGEPTLCKSLGWLINKTKDEFAIPIAVITNGSLLSRKDVRKDLMKADVVLPSIDAGTENIFRKIDRPHKDIDFQQMINGIQDFRNDFSGEIWAEVMLVKDLNDSEKDLLNIKNILDKIKPDKIYISTPIRPPAEAWVEIPNMEKILFAQKLFKDSQCIIEKENGEFGIEKFENASQALYEISSRHPLRKNQAQQIEKEFKQEGTLSEMLKKGDLVDFDYQNSIYIFPGIFRKGGNGHN